MRNVDSEHVMKLLTSSHLMDDKERALGHDLIKADALSFSKWVTGLVAAGGSLASVATGIAAWAENETALTIALLAVMGSIVVATILVAGWIVTNDVKARAATQQARYAARAAVLNEYMEFLDDTNTISALVRAE